MSVADCEIDEPDAETCEAHRHPVPCAICRLDYEEYAAECKREAAAYRAHDSLKEDED